MKKIEELRQLYCCAEFKEGHTITKYEQEVLVLAIGAAEDILKRLTPKKFRIKITEI